MSEQSYQPHNKVIASNEKTDIITQSEIPNNMGFHPAAFIFSRDKPTPIKNKVKTRIDLETLVIEVVIKLGKEK